MTDTKITFLVFPLFVMFMVTLVSIGSFSGEASEEFFGRRSMTEYQENVFDNFVTLAYDDYGEDPNGALLGGDWSLLETTAFVNNLTDLQDDEFGSDPGNETISFKLLNFMRELYTAEAVRVTDNDIVYHISLDPVTLAEWEELNSGSIKLDDVLVFVGVFFGIVILIGIVGIRIFGIGLADTSIMVILQVTVFLLVWALLSISSYSQLFTIPVFGAIVWIVLTFMYMVGVLLTITGGD